MSRVFLAEAPRSVVASWSKCCHRPRRRPSTSAFQRGISSRDCNTRLVPVLPPVKRPDSLLHLPFVEGESLRVRLLRTGAMPLL